MGLIKEIIIWILIIVVASMIINYGGLGFISGTFNDIKGKFVGTMDKDDSVKSCLSQVNEQIYIDKEKSSVNIKRYIKEYKKFNTTQDALEYLDYWEIPSTFSLGLGQASDWLRVRNSCLSHCKGYEKYSLVKQKDIILGLIKTEIYIEGQTIKSLEPFLCIDKEYKTKSMCPEGVKTGIKIIKHNDFLYEISSELNNLKSYNLTLLDMKGNILDYTSGINPSGGLLEVKLEDKSITRGITYFEFTTPCGNYRR